MFRFPVNATSFQSLINHLCSKPAQNCTRIQSEVSRFWTPDTSCLITAICFLISFLLAILLISRFPQNHWQHFPTSTACRCPGMQDVGPTSAAITYTKRMALSQPSHHCGHQFLLHMVDPPLRKAPSALGRGD